MPDRLKQVVAGEPSLGTPHPHEETLVNANPTVTTDVTVTCTNIPAMATIEGYFRLAGPTAGRQGFVKNMATVVHGYAQNPTTSTYGVGWFKVRLDVNKQFLWAVDNADVTEFQVFCLYYYL